MNVFVSCFNEQNLRDFFARSFVCSTNQKQIMKSARGELLMRANLIKSSLGFNERQFLWIFYGFLREKVEITAIFTGEMIVGVMTQHMNKQTSLWIFFSTWKFDFDWDINRRKRLGAIGEFVHLELLLKLN